MKSIRDYLAEDMWGHILMSGDAVKGCVTGETCKTNLEKKEYCQGIMTVFPHMLLSNFSRWFWDRNMPKDYKAFMDASVPALQSKVFPALDAYFAEGSALTESQRGELMIPILTDTIPKHVLTGFYDYMFAGSDGYKDISSYWDTVAPLLHMTARVMETAYRADIPTEEKAELFLYIGTRYPFLLIKRWYDWQFGKEELKMPPPPPDAQ